MSSFINSPFQSFWMAGYECTDKLNAFGNRVDFLQITGHLDLIDSDYELLKPFHLTTVREGIRWSQVEKSAYNYDWSVVKQMIRKGRLHNIQQIWDLCHFGFPDDLTPLHPMFARRFAALCRSFIQMFRSVNPDAEIIVIPINEVNFLSWLGGDVRGTSPYCVGQGWEVKYYLMKAYIEGVAAMKEVDPAIRILTAEPLVNMVPPESPSEEHIIRAKEAFGYQFQSTDMLCGELCPELGGRPEYLDILGYNYYYNNQWVVDMGEMTTFLNWKNLVEDPRFRPLSSLLAEAHLRYKRPFMLTETGHSREDRPLWLESITEQAIKSLDNGLPLWGICLYPIIDRPDWDHLTPWHASGLWDAELNATGHPGRVLYEPMAEALIACQKMMAAAGARIAV